MLRVGNFFDYQHKVYYSLIYDYLVLLIFGDFFILLRVYSFGPRALSLAKGGGWWRWGGHLSSEDVEFCDALNPGILELSANQTIEARREALCTAHIQAHYQQDLLFGSVELVV